MADALEEVQVDERIGQGIAVGDGLTVTQTRALATQSHSLTIDAFGGRALTISVFVGLAVTASQRWQSNPRVAWAEFVVYSLQRPYQGTCRGWCRTAQAVAMNGSVRVVATNGHGMGTILQG